jgi:hypothetical protein
VKTPYLEFLLITALILASMNSVAVVYSETDTTFECFSRERLGLLVQIEVTAIAWPGESANVTITATATQANVHIRCIHVNVSSLKENRSETPLSSNSFLEDVHLSLGDSNQTSYGMLIPEDSLPGLLCGELEYAWSIEGEDNAEEEINAFPATYIQNKPYQDLLENYEALSNSRDALQKNYTSLEANYTDLQQNYQTLADGQTAQDNATGLMYIFLITTAIFVVTTILLLAKRPKAPTW